MVNVRDLLNLCTGVTYVYRSCELRRCQSCTRAQDVRCSSARNDSAWNPDAKNPAARNLTEIAGTAHDVPITPKRCALHGLST